jgi:hypothetical protein
MAEVRKIALANYGPAMLKTGEPYGAMRDLRLWMIYLQERYAIEFGQKYIGGLLQNIVVKGKEDNLPPTEFIPGTKQREILGLMLDAIEPEKLVIPETLLSQLVPDPGVNREDMSDDPVFDQLRAARILAAMVIEPLFDADRSERIVALSARQPDPLTYPQLVDAVLDATWGKAPSGSAQEQALLRVTQNVAMLSMMKLGAAKDASPEAQYFVLDALSGLAEELEDKRSSDPLTAAFYRESARQIERFLDDPAGHAPGRIMPDWGEQPRSRYPSEPGPPLG